MATRVEELYQAALSLSDTGREQLVRLLEAELMSASGEPERAALREAERRHQEVLRGNEPLVPGEDVMRELRGTVSK